MNNKAKNKTHNLKRMTHCIWKSRDALAEGQGDAAYTSNIGGQESSGGRANIVNV